MVAKYINSVLIVLITLFVIQTDVRSQVFKSFEWNVLSFDYCEGTNKIYAGVWEHDLDYYKLNVVDATTGVVDLYAELEYRPLDIEISDDCEYVYISYLDTSLIQRYFLSPFSLDISFGLPTYSGKLLYANDIEIFKPNPEAIAVVLNDFTNGIPERGISTYLNGVEKDLYFDHNITQIELSDNGSMLYGYNSTSTSNDISAIQIEDYTFASNTFYNNIVDAISLSTEMEILNDNLYFSDGTIINTIQDSIWLDSNTFPVNTNFNKITKNSSSTRVFTVSHNVFYYPTIFNVNVSDPLVAETIYFPDDLGFEPDLIVTDVKSTNCDEGIIIQMINLNAQYENEFGRLIIYNPNIVSHEEIICEGDSIQFNGQYYSETGVYINDSNYDSNNCDSTLEQLDLYVIPTENYFTAVYCEELVITIEGQPVTESGIYSFYSTNQLGCDSVNIYDVEFLEMEEIVIDTFGSLGDHLYGIDLTMDTTVVFEIDPQVGCDYTLIVNIDLITSVKETESIVFNVFPNPVNDNLQIQTSISEFNVKIYTSNGEEMKCYPNLNSDSNLNLSSLPSGVYFVKIYSDEIATVKKICKF